MKLKLMILGIAVVGSLQACHNPDQKWDSKSSADTLNNMKDSVADPNKSVTKDLVMTVNKRDAKFAVEAAVGNLAEVQLGKLATAKATSQAVKDFGAMMVKDHNTANERLMVLAKSKGISLPTDLNIDDLKLKDDLSKRAGKKFDKDYIDAMIKDHQDDIKTFILAIQEVKDPELKEFATNTLPTLKMHLAAVQALKQ